MLVHKIVSSYTSLGNVNLRNQWKVLRLAINVFGTTHVPFCSIFSQYSVNQNASLPVIQCYGLPLLVFFIGTSAQCECLLYCLYTGTVPGPIIFGAIIDSTCLVWQEKCGQNGSCWVYDNGLLSQRVLILAVCIKSLSSFFFIMATVLYKAPPDDTSSMTKSTQSTDDVSNGTRDISYAMKSLESVEGHKDFPGYVECRDRGYVNPAFSDDLGSSTTGNATGSRPDGQDEAL